MRAAEYKPERLIMKKALLIIMIFFVAACSQRDDKAKKELYQETRSTSEVFTLLLDYYRMHHPEIAESLNPPVDQMQLDKLEKLIGRKLPPDFRSLYLLADGQKEKTPPFFPDGYVFFSLTDLEIEWKALKDTHSARSDFHMGGMSPGRVRDYWWHPMWVPFAKTSYGDYLCLDLFPTKRGRIGQVIQFLQNSVERECLGLSVTDFLGEYETKLSSGEYYFNSEYGFFVPKEKK